MPTQYTGTPDFNRKTVAALKRKGILLIAPTFIPGADGSFANGERAYSIDDNGTHRVRTFAEVLALAAQ